jgi:hypothetical protein
MMYIMGTTHYKMKWAERKKNCWTLYNQNGPRRKRWPQILYMKMGRKLLKNVLKPAKKLGQMGPPSWPNKPNPWRADVAVSATSDSMSPCWSGSADVACIHDVSICHCAVPQNLPKSYSMMIVDVTVAPRLWRFFRTLNNYDVDSMTVFYTLTDSYLWQFLGCLWPIQTIIY